MTRLLISNLRQGGSQDCGNPGHPKLSYSSSDTSPFPSRPTLFSHRESSPALHSTLRHTCWWNPKRILITSGHLLKKARRPWSLTQAPLSDHLLHYLTLPCSTGTRGEDTVWRRCSWKWKLKALVSSKQHGIAHWWGEGACRRRKFPPEADVCSWSQKGRQRKGPATPGRDSCRVSNPLTFTGAGMCFR